MRYVIEHELEMHFAEPVFEHQCEVRLIPATTPQQRVSAATLTTEPETRHFTYIDYFGNNVHHFDLSDAHDTLITRTRIDVETLLSNPFDYAQIAPERERVWIAEALRAQPRLWDFVLHRSALTPSPEVLAQAGAKLPDAPENRRVIESVIAARDWVAETLRYVPEREEQAAAPSDLIVAGAGNAADLAHVLISIVRGWGIPARYVSGYQDCADADEGEDVEPRPHAWAEVLIPGAGWRGVDPTARLLTSDTYVCVALGRDARDAAPQRCAFKGDGEGAAPRNAVRVQRQQ